MPHRNCFIEISNMSSWYTLSNPRWDVTFYLLLCNIHNSSWLVIFSPSPTANLISTHPVLLWKVYLRKIPALCAEKRKMLWSVSPNLTVDSCVQGVHREWPLRRPPATHGGSLLPCNHHVQQDNWSCDWSRRRLYLRPFQRWSKWLQPSFGHHVFCALWQSPLLQLVCCGNLWKRKQLWL